MGGVGAESSGLYMQPPPWAGPRCFPGPDSGGHGKLVSERVCIGQAARSGDRLDRSRRRALS